MIETNEGNKIIAEFMGAVVNKNYEDELTYCYQKENVPTTHSSYNWAVSQMQYHTSWDWLMPVVQNIEDIEVDFLNPEKGGCFPYEVAIVHKTQVEIYDHKEEKTICFVESETKIDAVFKAVIQFITWFNSQPQQP